MWNVQRTQNQPTSLLEQEQEQEQELDPSTLMGSDTLAIITWQQNALALALPDIRSISDNELDDMG